MLALYLIAWAVLMFYFQRFTFKFTRQETTKTNVWLKATIIFVIAFVLFASKQYLAAFVVTFPYNGVFAVYENRFGLQPQAALFTRNSIALVAYFVANYLAGQHFSEVVRIILSWLAFAVVISA